jgi:hypothetical protein
MNRSKGRKKGKGHQRRNESKEEYEKPWVSRQRVLDGYRDVGFRWLTMVKRVFSWISAIMQECRLWVRVN